MPSIIDEYRNYAKASGKQILMDAVTQAENAAKDAFNGMVDQATGALKMDKNFIHIREFYNFMRIGNGQNAPTPFFYFSPNFYNGANEIDLETGVTKEHTFFKDHIGEFARFRYCIQAISFPSLSLRSYDSGTGGGSNAYKDITNLFGGYTTLQNSFINADTHTLDMNILNTHKPVVENFVYPWMLDALRSFYGGPEGGTPIPRVNMAVKFWSPNHITHQMEGVKPDFIYYVTGLFPVKIKGYNPIQMPNDSAIQRNVTFAFNDFIIINSESDALKYNLGEFFIGNFIHDIADKAIRDARKFVNDGLGDLASKLRNKIDDKKKKPESPRTPPKGNSPSGSNGDGKNKTPENPNADDSGNKNNNDNNSENKNQTPENPTNQQQSQNNNQMNSQQASQNSSTPQSTNRNQLTSANVQNSSTPSSTRSSSNVGNLTLNSAQSLSNSPSKDNSSNFSNMSLDDNIQMMNILNADDSLGEIIETENEFEAATENANSIDRESYSTEGQMNSNEAIDRASSSEPVQTRSLLMMNRNQLSTYSPEPQESSTSLLSRDEAVELNSSNVKKYSEPTVTVDRLDHSASLRAPVSNYKNVSRSSNVVKTSQSPVSSYSSINRDANSVDLSSTSAVKANPQSQAALDSVKDRYSQNLNSIKTSNLSKNDLQSRDALKSYDKTAQSSNNNNELDSIARTNDVKAKAATMSMTDAVSKVMNSRDDEEIIEADDELSAANNKKEEYDERTRSQVNDSLKADVNDKMIEPINSESSNQMSLPRVSDEYGQEANVKKVDRSAISSSELGTYASNEPLVIKDGKLAAYERPDTNVSESVKNAYELKTDGISVQEALNRTNLPSSSKNDNSLNTLEEIDRLEHSSGYQKAEYVESQEFNVKDIAKSYDNVSSIMNPDLAMHSTTPGSNYINKVDDANAKMQAGQYVERQEDIERSTNAHKSNISVREAIDNSQYLNSDDEIIIDADDELNVAQNKIVERMKSSNQIDSSMRVDISEKESTPINNGTDSQLDRSQVSEMSGQDIQKMQVIESESSITDRLSFSDEERSINSEKSNMSLTENVEMVKTRNSDEDFEEIIDAEDEKQTHAEMNTNDVLASLKKSITSESSLNTNDYENISSILIKDQNITSEKYNIFEQYASAARKDVKDVLKEYKGLTKDDLGKFANDVQNTLVKKKEEAAAKLENPIEVSNGKLVTTPLKERSEIEAEEIKKKNSNKENTVEISYGKIVPQITQEKTPEEIEKLKQKSNKAIELKKVQDTNVNAHPQIIPVKKISQDDINDLF